LVVSDRANGIGDVETIEAELERARARVAASMRRLGDEVERRRDWRSWVRARPTLVLVCAFALGALIERRHHGNDQNRR
jgi:hypothetical protein